MELVPLAMCSEGRTELRKATGFWMGLGVELLEAGEAACGGDWVRPANTELRYGAEISVGEDVTDRGLAGDRSTRVGKTRGAGGGGENGGRVGELAADDELNSAASSLSSGTGDSVGDGLITGDSSRAATNSWGRE